MARTLDAQAEDLDRAMAELVAKYQFRDRNESVGFGLSVSQAYALRALGEGPLTMGALASALHLSVSAVTRVVDPLAGRGLVERHRDEGDRRICRVAMTAAGRRLWRRIHGELVDADREVLRRIDASERETVIRAIRDLSRSVDAWRRRRDERGG